MALSGKRLLVVATLRMVADFMCLQTSTCATMWVHNTSTTSILLNSRPILHIFSHSKHIATRTRCLIIFLTSFLLYVDIYTLFNIVSCAGLSPNNHFVKAHHSISPLYVKFWQHFSAPISSIYSVIWHSHSGIRLDVTYVANWRWNSIFIFYK